MWNNKRLLTTILNRKNASWIHHATDFKTHNEATKNSEQWDKKQTEQ